MNGTQAYVLSKGYTDESILGISGVLAGKNCTIKSITTSPDGKYNIVTFEWTANDGTVKTSTMEVQNGTDTEIEAYIDHGTKLATITIDGVPTDIYAPVGVSGVELSQAEYDALPEEEKLNGTVYYIYDGQGGGGGSAVLTRELIATKTVGGVTAGDTYPVNTTLETIIRDVLSPVLYPTFEDPSANIAGTGVKLLESGSTLAVTLTTSFNRGSISPAYGTSGYRSGVATGYALNGGAIQTENTFNETVSELNRSFSVTVNYAQGEQPKDSSGNDYDTPLASGSVLTNTLNYDFVDAMWGNVSSIDTIAKLSLIAKSTKQRDMVFPAQTITNPEVFDVPASWNISAIQVKNDLSGAFENASDQFTVTDVTHDNAGGVSVAYKRYTFNMGMATGARTVRIKWN